MLACVVSVRPACVSGRRTGEDRPSECRTEMWAVRANKRPLGRMRGGNAGHDADVSSSRVGDHGGCYMAHAGRAGRPDLCLHGGWSGCSTAAPGLSERLGLRTPGGWSSAGSIGISAPPARRSPCILPPRPLGPREAHAGGQDRGGHLPLQRVTRARSSGLAAIPGGDRASLRPSLGSGPWAPWHPELSVDRHRRRCNTDGEARPCEPTS